MTYIGGEKPHCPGIESRRESSDIGDMERSLEQMARSLVESGDYRVTSRLGPLTEYHPPDNSPKLVAAVVDVETTGTNPDRDKIIELGICLFEYDRQKGRIYKVLGCWEWFEDPGLPIPSEITKITGITDAMVAGHRIDDCAVNDLLGRVVLVIAHNADFDRRFLEKRLPIFADKHWACSRSDIDWKAEGIRSSALEFVAYSLGFFHDGHRAASGCRATVHALAQRLPGSGRLALQTLLEKARLPTWRYGRGTPLLGRRISSRPEVTPGAPESLGDRNAGIATCRLLIERQRCHGSDKM
jgi:DNA polymerase III subunit epsilon